MTPKLVARAIVFIVTFLLIQWLIEASSLVSLSVDERVSSGAVTETAAPRLAAGIELLVAAVLAVFATTHTIGDKAADLLVRLWEVMMTKVRSTYERDARPESADEGLDTEATLAFLGELDRRVTALEQDKEVQPQSEARKRSATKQ